MTDLAAVILVDRRGRVLLQERDEHAPIAPDKWAFSGGHLEPGEDFRTGAVRELAEETEVVLSPEDLTEVGIFEVFHAETGSLDRLALFAAPVDLTDADIVCHEGRRIVFVDPEAAAGLDLGEAAARLLPVFLASETYARLRAGDVAEAARGLPES